MKAFILSNCSAFWLTNRGIGQEMHTEGRWQCPWKQAHSRRIYFIPHMALQSSLSAFPTSSPLVPNPSVPRIPAADTRKTSGTPGHQVLLGNVLCSLKYVLYSANVSPATSNFCFASSKLKPFCLGKVNRHDAGNEI